MTKTMRRADQAISESEAQAILQSGEYGILSSVSADGQPYGMPVSYAYTGEAIYFHCALEGHRLENLSGKSADDPQWVSLLERADLIYFSGGDPGYLFETMNGSRAWNAAGRAWERGAVYAGCSAGAMILAQRMPRFRLQQTRIGFGVVPSKYIVPHFDAIPAAFKPLVRVLMGKLKPNERMIGVDEDTALVGALGGEWKVMGRGKVHVFTREGEQIYESGQMLLLDQTS